MDLRHHGKSLERLGTGGAGTKVAGSSDCGVLPRFEGQPVRLRFRRGRTPVTGSDTGEGKNKNR